MVFLSQWQKANTHDNCYYYHDHSYTDSKEEMTTSKPGNPIQDEEAGKGMSVTTDPWAQEPFWVPSLLEGRRKPITLLESCLCY